jgi:hypothetical protein
VDSYVEVLDHAPGDWIIDKEPAQGEAGSKHKECTICGRTLETEVIQALPVETDVGSETDTEENEMSTTPEVPTDPEPSWGSSDSSSGCSGIVSMTAGGIILMIAIASTLLIKRRKENY